MRRKDRAVTVRLFADEKELWDALAMRKGIPTGEYIHAHGLENLFHRYVRMPNQYMAEYVWKMLTANRFNDVLGDVNASLPDFTATIREQDQANQHGSLKRY